MIGINSIILNTPSDELEKVLSPFIREQFPSFVRSDYGKLVLFIKAYYEWLDGKGNPSYVTANLESVGDVDNNLEEFYSHFKTTYLQGFPEGFTQNELGESPNKKTLLKKIREFYGKKGTESAYKFLFNVFYDSDLEIYYPSSDLLKSSDGEWIEPTSIKTTSTNGRALFGGKGGNLYQYNGAEVSASAFINSVVQYSFNGLPVTEFFLTDINGVFNTDQNVIIVNGDSSWAEQPYSVLGDFYVELPGSGYRIGDTVTVFDTNGKGFSAKVQQTGLAGGIKKIDIINSGLNYQYSAAAGVSADYFLLSIFSDNGQQSAKVYGKRSALTRYPGYFSSNRGKLSSNKKIQDSNYYQTFSYELKSGASIDSYFEILKNLVHPAGTKMFGSILVKKFIENNISSSTQATYYETPVIGKYTPYKTTSTVDLRNNGITESGYWLGATGDLYPLGYNPYIGSTSQVGPNGRTTPVGTVFVGGSLGYTWCYVPEDGRTAHDPIGAPLGSTAAWYSGNETSWTPAGMRGLVLWLRPENIGVCGAVANGATVDVWRDASPRQNHAVPPTWDRINYPVEYFKQTTALDAATGWSSTEGFGSGPYTNYTATHGHTAPDGSLTATRIVRLAGSSGDGLMYAKYMSFVTGRKYRYSIMMRLGESFPSDTINLGTVYGPRVYNGTSPGYGSPYSTALVSKNYWTKVEVEFTATNSANATLRAFEHGHVDIYGTGTGINNYVDMYVWAPTVEDITNVGYGVTLDKLRPRLFAASIAGPTGVCFNGGVLYSPSSTWNGLSLSSQVGLGLTYGATTVPEQILTAQHLYLKNGITLSADADIFMVFRSTTDDWKRGAGVISSNTSIANITRSDSVVHHRSYNLVDRDPAKLTGEYYLVTPTGKFLYPSSLPVGLAGFRPGGSQVDRSIVSYDPHVSGVCFGTAIGEWSRDTDGVVESYLNGDKSLNKSRSTGLFMSAGSYPSIDDFAIDAGLEFYLDAGKTACVGKFVQGQEKNLIRNTLFTPIMRNILKPLDVGAFGRDSTTPVDPVTRVPGGGGSISETLPNPYTYAEVFRIRTGTSGNFYISPGIGWTDPNYVGFKNKAWTAIFYIRRVDGQAMTSANAQVYIHFDNVWELNQGNIESAGNGWYRISRTRKETATDSNGTVIERAPTLIGLSGLGSGIEYYVAGMQLLPYAKDSGAVEFGETTTGITAGTYQNVAYIYGTPMSNRIERFQNPWGDFEATWRGVNHSVNPNTSFWNGGFVTSSQSIDPTKMYRFSVWVNKVNAQSGTVYFGLITNGSGSGSQLRKRSTGLPADWTNPYFTANSWQSFDVGGWNLLVGHVHPAGSPAGSHHPNSGFYRRSGGGITYAGLLDLSVNYGDWIWESTANRTQFRIGMYGSDSLGSEARFLRPRIDLVDGTEPTIQELLDNVPHTIYDISGKGYNMNALTPPMYEYENGGSLVFTKTRTSGVRSIRTDVLDQDRVTNSTWEGWVRPTATPFGNGMWMNGNPFPYFTVDMAGNQWNSYAIEGVQTGISSQPPVSIVPEKFIHLVTSFEYTPSTNTTLVKSYVNGRLAREITHTGKSTIYQGGIPILLGTYGLPEFFVHAGGGGGLYYNYYYNGKIAVVRMYSRTLSQQEIVQNYNSSRVRFGV